MPNYICVACGTQYRNMGRPPEKCTICQDERQYVGWSGQEWTTLHEMTARKYRNKIKSFEPDLYKIITVPAFAIGQRAFLLTTSSGNLLWDCLTYLDVQTITAIKRLGGIDTIAISHPHYYSSMVEWSEKFGKVPVFINELDRRWVMHPSEHIVYWSGEKRKLFAGLELVRLGGHFDGGTVLHWPQGAHGKGVVLSGDIIQVAFDRRWVSFMHSYPNMIPLSPKKVRHIADTIRAYKFERIYSAFEKRDVLTDARGSVERSADRYVDHLTDH